MMEQGIPSPEVFTPMLLMAPRATPDATVVKLDTACKKMTGHKAYGKLLKKAGLPAKYLSGPDATAYYAKLTDTWAPIVDELKKTKKKK
jgi:tripartite-type tricarboxylate transporter receptor subunit TctC